MSENGQVVQNSLYIYAPSKVAPIIFTALFAISAIGHVWQCCHYKSWKMSGLQPFVAVIFTAGYALREVGAFRYTYDGSQEQNLIIYIMNQVLVYIGPPLLELCNYHILGRMFSYIPWLSPFPPGNVLMLFGGLMGLVEAFNGIGVAFTSNPTGNKQEAGKGLVLASLSIQLCVITSFFVMSTIFLVRCFKANIRNKAIPSLPYTLYVSMVLILIRSIYRVVQHAGNTTMNLHSQQELESLSPIMRYEWYFLVFEGATMLLNSLLWNVFNAGRFLPQDEKVFLDEDGKTEMYIPSDPNDEVSPAQLLRLVMQLLTFGLWGLVFPKKETNKEEYQTSERELNPSSSV
ncbi:uncharacterized protein N7459_004112 [Penicillium hispanicum]|uniref:uncharacterized protein n=1 Tax=Penicillium hispanicum TaxID=1080232 RepID=UPI00254139D7|nr:uncharacterized protein N7459_004112 [Penicillium hispanicum]KAJ5584312.1 hypothetical protein N7459_004112 [Penicillium hispanicum]